MFKGFFNRMVYGRSDKPDLTPEDMAQNKFQLFFEILGVRFWDIIKLNLLLILFMIPLLIWSGINISVFLNPDLQQSEISSYIMMYLLGLIPCLVILGPALAGMNYVIRKYASDEHAWLWSDFKEHAKANWKQSVIYMLIIGVSMYVGYITMNFYNLAAADNFLLYIMRALFIVFFTLFLMSSMYVFPMMVTFKLKLKDIIKNAMIFTISRLHFTIIFNLLALLPTILLIWLSFVWPYAYIGLFIYYGLFGFAFSAFIMNSYTHQTFKKYMMTDEDTPVEAEKSDQ